MTTTSAPAPATLPGPVAFPDDVAAVDPERPAILLAASGRVIRYGELVIASRRLARWLWDDGVRTGEVVALLLDNDAEFLPISWAAQRSGLRYLALSTRLQAAEIAYILGDSGATTVFTNQRLRPLAVQALADAPGVTRRLSTDLTGANDPDGFRNIEILDAPADPGDHDHGDRTAGPPACEGVDLLYSSGTTGRPKGVVADLPLAPLGTPPGVARLLRERWGLDEHTVYLSPAPLYHAAPLRFCMTVHRAGGLVIVMDRFDAEQALELIARHRVTHTQMVPTMLLRILKLDPTLRRQHDLSSLRAVIHAAAPMPVTAKRALIDWLGPIVHEYYSATENYLFSAIDSGEWLTHQGSVGRPLSGLPHILDDAGRELPPGGVGTIWSADGLPFEYLHDRDRTAASRNEQGWTTVGDLGFLDEQGYLYLSDRRTDLILSGGVNVYPQEAENVLVEHPDVADVAVFGIPHDELGQVAHAVVQPRPGRSADAAFATELLRWCEQRLARYKCPRSIDFDPELPRTPTGKLLRRVVRDRYLPGD